MKKLKSLLFLSVVLASFSTMRASAVAVAPSAVAVAQSAGTSEIGEKECNEDGCVDGCCCPKALNTPATIASGRTDGPTAGETGSLIQAIIKPASDH